MKILISTEYFSYEEDIILYSNYYYIYSTFSYFNIINILITIQIGLKNSIFLNQNKKYNKYYLYKYLNYEHIN